MAHVWIIARMDDGSIGTQEYCASRKQARRWIDADIKAGLLKSFATIEIRRSKEEPDFDEDCLDSIELA